MTATRSHAEEGCQPEIHGFLDLLAGFGQEVCRKGLTQGR